MATEFGKILRILRINTGETAKEMANKLDVSVPYLNAIENGRRDIPSDMEEKVIAHYNLTTEEKTNLRNAIINTKDSVKINLTDLADKKKRVILALARDNIDNETLDKICKIVNVQGEEK